MRHHHVAVRAGGIVEAAAPADRQCLRHVDLHVVDVLAVPDRLEQPVREPQRQDVLRRLLPEEVVDAKHLILAEHGVHLSVQPAGAREVRPERLLHDHPGALHHPRLTKAPHHALRRLRGHAEVVKATRRASQFPVRLRNRGREPGGSRAGRHEPQAPGERLPLGQLHGTPAELLARFAGEVPKAVVADLFQRRPHDAVLRHQAGAAKVQEPRQELAPRQVAARPEQHDDVRLQGRDDRRFRVVRVESVHAPTLRREPPKVFGRAEEPQPPWCGHVGRGPNP
jgi:hypothetical protein